MDIRKRVGLRIRAARRQHGLSQSELAAKLERSIDTVSAIERGLSLPNLETLEGLARVLGVPLRDFFDFEEQGATPKQEKALAELLTLARQMSDRQLALCLELARVVVRAD
ncbi:MAG: helix-turn-helix domain-containing protein [Hyphomicrobiales bacterium]|nr:MAG: helix-turn-helix domain-containing protein [Hyphomicrobiales bacterium]